MKKKMISMLLAVTMAAAMAAGCGSDADSGTDAGDSNAGGTNADNAADAEDTSAADNNEADNNAENESAGGGEKTTLKWAIWDEKTAPYWQAMIDAYEKKNPDVKIETTDLGSADYMTVLATELSGSGSDFDIVTIKDVPGYATLVAKGVLEPLDERISQDNIDLELYNGATDQVMADGSLYELPFRSDF